MSPKLTRALFILTFIISAALRLGLSLVNREANDPHMEVVIYVLQHGGSLPAKDDCWECFQPKLYHVLTVGVIRAANLTDPNAQILAANLFNFVLGLLTLAVTWRFLTQLPLQNELLRWLAFAFVAFNPNLIGISSQVTNDALLIFFSTLAIYETWLFLKEPKLASFILLTLLVILAASTKTNGWVTFTAILLAVLLRAVFDRPNRLRLETCVLAYLIVVPLVVIINPLNQYILNYQKYGMPLVNNINPALRPALFAQSPTNKPGIRSIADGFFTFRFTSLLETPYINYDFNDPLPHRTSFWTQLYGRAQSVNFDNWPPSWNSTDPGGFFERRAIFILALIPTALLLIGAGIETWQLLHKNDANGPFILAFLGYVGFVALYAYLYREYPVMKAVFTYPALPAFPVLFLTAAQKLPGWALKALTALSVILFAFYIYDVIALIIRL